MGVGPKVGSEANFNLGTATEPTAAASDGAGSDLPSSSLKGVFRAAYAAESAGTERPGAVARCLVLWHMVGSLVTFIAIRQDDNLAMTEAALAAITGAAALFCGSNSSRGCAGQINSTWFLSPSVLRRAQPFLCGVVPCVTRSIWPVVRCGLDGKNV